MKHSIFFYLAFVFQLALSPAATADFSAAMEIYNDKRFDEAKEAFETLSAIGDRGSLFNLGVMYYRGEGVVTDPIKAFALMHLASDGYDDEMFPDVASRIHQTFSQEQKEKAVLEVAELTLVYGRDAIENSIFPKMLSDEDCQPEILPILKVAPLYPRSEQLAGRMGMTITEYNVSPEGYVRDIYVARSTNKVFTRASVRAAKKFRYEPLIDGKPFFGAANKFTYQLADYRGKVRVRTRVLRLTIKELRLAAENNDAVAQYKYAQALNDFRSFREALKDMNLEYRAANMWYERSAKGGLPHAQFTIGKNMMSGRGCEIDEVNGLKWIKAAAVSGHAPAQQLLAQQFSRGEDESGQSALAAMSWLRNAALSDYSPAKIQLAWELATSAIPELRDAEKSLNLLEDSPDGYFDDVRILETQAAAYAALGDYKKAVKLQKKAIGEADDLEWSIPLMHDRLGVYEHGKPWVGGYF